MRVYFRQVKILQFLTLLNIVFFLLVAASLIALSALWYVKLPTDDPLRSEFKLGKLMTKFEFAHLFYDWRNLNIPIYDLTISRKKSNKIIQDLPPKDSLMTEEYKNYSKAIFSYDSKTYNVRVRIRGKDPNHWVDPKKSWRIKFSSKELFQRKESLNLIIPQDRGFFAEYLSNHIARKMGLLVPDDKFVFLRINGILQGVYYEIEQPTGSFLELHSKVDTANFYREDNWDWFKYGLDPIFSDVGHWKKNSKERVSQFDNYAELDYLLSLINKSDDSRFYREMPALINMDNFLTWQAQSMIMGSYHQSEHGNMSLYFNIIDGKFEFMPTDLNIFPLAGQFFDKPCNPLVERILMKPEYLHLRNLILWKYISDANNLKDDLQFYDSAYKKYKKAFYTDRNKGFTNLSFDKQVKRLRDIFLANRAKIISNLGFASIFANIHLVDDNTILASIDMVSQGFSAAEIVGLKIYFGEKKKEKDIAGYPAVYVYYDSNNSGFFEKSDTLITKLTPDSTNKYYKGDNFSCILYPGRDKQLQPAKRYHKLFIITSERLLDIQEPVNFEFTAVNAVTKEKIEPRYHYIDNTLFKYFSRITGSLEEFISLYPIFKKDVVNPGTLILSAGEYVIDKLIIVPMGVNLIIEPGTVLKFSRGVSFVSYGKVTAKGAKDMPIIFTALDVKEPWGNFAVVGQGCNGTEFDYVIAEYGSESFINGIYFTGVLAIHSASAKISSCILRYNTGDDTVNTKTGESVIQNSVFYKNHSDGADYDFSKGEVMGNYFKDNGADSVNLCRSDIYIDGNLMEGSGDTGVDAGEESNPIIVNNLIRMCNIGIVTKDSSNPLIINNTIVENNNGIEAYTKNQIFGPARGVVRNTVLWNNKNTLKIDSESKLDIGFSIVEGGYKGNNIFITAPAFIDEKTVDYRLSAVKMKNQLLILSSDIESLRQLPKYQSIKEAPIGILSNPKVLSISDFKDK